MAMTKQTQYYLVQGAILPEVIIKTVKAKELLNAGAVATVKEAVEKVGISRSVFYKYKNGILPFYESLRECVVTITLELLHESGVLSEVLGTVAEFSGNVLTINQTLPLQGMAIVTLTVETNSMSVDMKEFMQKLEQIHGVKKAQIVGQT